MGGLMRLEPTFPVERSRMLDNFNFSQYTPDEMLLLDVYLAKINPNDVSSKRVQFRKKEYELFREQDQQKPAAFKKAALGLYAKFVDCAVDEMGFDPKHIWKELSFKKEGKEWVFTMECDEQMEQFFFDTQKYGFIRYLVGYTKNFTSKHSYILYYFLKRKRQEELKFKNAIRPTIAELKRITGTTSKKTYKEFKFFRRDVINRAIDEINLHTDIHVDYEVVMSGGKAHRIHFIVEEKKDPPMFGQGGGSPSDELKHIFAEEIEAARALPSPDPDVEEQMEVQLPNGESVMVDRWAIIAAKERKEDLAAPKRRGRPKKTATTEAAPAPEAPAEPERAPTVYEMDLMAAIPPEVHQNELPRVDAILNIIRKYVPYPDILTYMQDGMSLAEASSAASDDLNEDILDIIHSFNTQEYNIRKGGIMHPNAHFSYYMVNLDGWLSKGRR